MATQRRIEELSDTQYLTGSEVLHWLSGMSEAFLADTTVMASVGPSGVVKSLRLLRGDAE